jgi:hypothetical protein
MQFTDMRLEKDEKRGKTRDQSYKDEKRGKRGKCI